MYQNYVFLFLLSLVFFYAKSENAVPIVRLSNPHTVVDVKPVSQSSEAPMDDNNVSLDTLNAEHQATCASDSSRNPITINLVKKEIEIQVEHYHCVNFFCPVRRSFSIQISEKIEADDFKEAIRRLRLFSRRKNRSFSCIETMGEKCRQFPLIESCPMEELRRCTSRLDPTITEAGFEDCCKGDRCRTMRKLVSAWVECEEINVLHTSWPIWNLASRYSLEYISLRSFGWLKKIDSAHQ